MKKFWILQYFFISALMLAHSKTARAKIFEESVKTEINKQMKAFKIGSGFSDASLAEIVAAVISVFLGLLGIIFTSLMVYAGYLWMTAKGNEERVKKAQDIFKEAVWGFGITVSAYAINYFIVTYITGAAGGEVEVEGD